MGELDRGAGPRSLSDIVNSGPSECGTFVYDEATLRSLITRWMELADHYTGSAHRTGLGTVDPPGLDFASDAMATSANTAGKAYLKYLIESFWFCVAQAQTLQNALDDYLGTEHQNVLAISKVATPPGDRPADPQPGI